MQYDKIPWTLSLFMIASLLFISKGAYNKDIWVNGVYLQYLSSQRIKVEHKKMQHQLDHYKSTCVK